MLLGTHLYSLVPTPTGVRPSRLCFCDGYILSPLVMFSLTVHALLNLGAICWLPQWVISWIAHLLPFEVKETRNCLGVSFEFYHVFKLNYIKNLKRLVGVILTCWLDRWWLPCEEHLNSEQAVKPVIQQHDSSNCYHHQLLLTLLLLVLLQLLWYYYPPPPPIFLFMLLLLLGLDLMQSLSFYCPLKHVSSEGLPTFQEAKFLEVFSPLQLLCWRHWRMIRGSSHPNLCWRMLQQY